MGDSGEVRRLEERVGELEADMAALQRLLVGAGAMLAGAHDDAPSREARNDR